MVRRWEILQGDCREAMKTLPDASVDAIVTDPPYELGFMGKGWDKTGVANDVAVWAECLRVLKPGGYLLAFSGTRTYHRMVCAVEDAGFEIRDQLAWVYGSGFPKSHNGPWGGTALKPAWEPIVMARKPLIGTVEENWMVHGTGALNVEGCRVETDENLNGGAYAKVRQESTSEWATLHKTTGAEFVQPAGRWPANLAHDGSDEVLAAFPQAPGQQGATGNRTQGVCYSAVTETGEGIAPRPDAGSAARFFYCAKASRRDRGDDNTHPTVKPTDLMRWLVRLVTPAGGVLLDPFTASGCSAKAARLHGCQFVGCELYPKYMKLA